MKLSKRDVNLILGVLSLLLIVAFIFLVYTPKYQKYQTELEKLTPYQQRLSEGKIAIENLPKLEETLNAYEAQRAKKEEVKEFVETDFFATIEELAEQTNVDLSTFATASATPSPATTTPSTETPAPTTPAPTQPNGADVTSGTTTPTTPPNGDATVAPTSTPQSSGGYAYSVGIKGEYRAIMVFLFELRNLEFPATIKGLQMKYNDGKSKTSGFPLQATFTISFDGLGGE